MALNDQRRNDLVAHDSVVMLARALWRWAANGAETLAVPPQ